MKARRHLRVPLPVPVRVRLVDEEEECKLFRLGDISWGGAFIVMDPPPPKGSRLIIQFDFSDESVSLELWATVVRVQKGDEKKPAGVGVEFDPLDPDAQALIQQLVDEEIRAMIKSLL